MGALPFWDGLRLVLKPVGRAGCETNPIKTSCISGPGGQLQNICPGSTGILRYIGMLCCLGIADHMIGITLDYCIIIDTCILQCS